jgi:hypothetical protein
MTTKGACSSPAEMFTSTASSGREPQFRLWCGVEEGVPLHFFTKQNEQFSLRGGEPADRGRGVDSAKRVDVVCQQSDHQMLEWQRNPGFAQRQRSPGLSTGAKS